MKRERRAGFKFLRMCFGGLKKWYCLCKETGGSEISLPGKRYFHSGYADLEGNTVNLWKKLKN